MGILRCRFVCRTIRYILIVIMAACLVPLTVTISAANNPPKADAGPDQTVPPVQLVTLAGSATDADSDAIVTWQWNIDSKPAGSNPYLETSLDDPIARFNAFSPGNYVISLVVSDGTDSSKPSTVTITVVFN